MNPDKTHQQFDPEQSNIGKQEKPKKKIPKRLIILLVSVMTLASIIFGAFIMGIDKKIPTDYQGIQNGIKQIKDTPLGQKTINQAINFKDALDLKIKNHTQHTQINKTARNNKRFEQHSEEIDELKRNQSVDKSKVITKKISGAMSAIDNRINVQTTSINNNQQLIKGLETRVKQILVNLKSMNDGLGNFENKFTQINNQQRKQGKATSDRLNKLIKLVKQADVKKKKAIKLESDTPPFDLVSVDIWDNVTSAIIKFKGRFSIISIDDIKFDWRLTDISFKDEVITVQHVVTNNIIRLSKTK